MMRLWRRHWLGSILLTLVAGCSNTTDQGPDFTFIPRDLSGDFAKSYPDLAAGGGSSCPDGGVDGGAPCVPQDPDGPVVTINAPTKDDVVPAGVVNVTATVMLHDAMERPLDTVVVYVAAKPAVAKPLSPTLMPGVWQGEFDLTGSPTGKITLAATATDVAGKQGSGQVTFTLDAGPKITVYDPKPGKFYRGQATLLFAIENPTNPPDPNFDVDPATIIATVQRHNLTAPTAIAGSSPPTWGGKIDFHDPAFGQGLSGDTSLQIQAKNKKGTQSTVNITFTVKETGPKITLVTPMAGNFVGGVIQIVAQIDDPAGVNGNTVYAVFGGDMTKSVQLTLGGGGLANQYVGQFDTRSLPAGFLTPILSVTAQDTLGNQSQVAAEVIVDNTPPAIDIDPPNDLRMYKKSVNMMGGMINLCSWQFDPVGSDNLNDGDVALQLSWLRARLEDRGNIATGQAILWYSLVDPKSVALYIIRTQDGPLVVDTDGDGVCDDINPDLIPTQIISQAKQALQLPLVPVPVSGTPDFTGDFSGSSRPPFCDQLGDPMLKTPPMPICKSTPIIYDLGYTYTSKEPAIWGIPPVNNAPDPACQGLQFDAANSVPDGPICVAVRAKDIAGNRNVSKPIRLCLDKGNIGLCDPNLYQQHDPTESTRAPNRKLLPDCTGIKGMDGKVRGFDTDGVSKCQVGVKYNTGVVVPMFSPNQVYFFQ